MGAFLATPVTEKVSENAENEELICGGSSMQGWRSTQEDAHNCILDFDTKTSLFAVYDGHGGADVAIYSAQNLPDAIKRTESYAKGDYVQALKDAFLEFDATLITEKVVKELEKIKSEAEEAKTDESEVEEECVNDLYEEATMPLAEVMAKYKNPSLTGKLPSSPCLRSKKNESEPGASSSSFDTPGCSSSFSNSESEVSSSSARPSSSKNESVKEAVPDSSSGPAPSSTASPSSSKPSSNSDPDSSSCNNIDSASSSSKKESPQKVLVNGIGDSVSSSQNGKEVKKEAETQANEVVGGSGDSVVKSSKNNGDSQISSSDGSAACKKSEKKRITPVRVGSTKLYEKLLAQGNGIDSSESDEDDETFEGCAADSDDDDDDEEGVLYEGDDEEDCDEDEESEDLEEEEDGEEDSDDLEDDDDDDSFFRTKEKVGEDSGCTAVVALVHNDTLYVANAGDSRCVVSRKREAIEMSFDHKPEDPPEKTRIVTAGGKVTADGRVNGGLNLSRALGDHSYKQNKSLGPTEQMISALPDIKTLDIDRSKDEFIVLACDGIWNSMTSQEVVDFIGERLDQETKKLTDICEELFDHCLAPSTIGDGTGCDNMTCIIVRWKKPGETNGLDAASVTRETKPVAQDNQSAQPTEATETTETKAATSEPKMESEKRCASPDIDESSRKKSKIE